MLRTIKIGAIVALSSVIGAQSTGAQSTGTQTTGTQTLTWGIFRENASDIVESSRNCWTQAMVSGETINGEIMAQNLTEQKAQIELQRMAKQGLCAAERTSTTWSARGQGHNGFDDAGSGGWSSGGSNGGRSGGDWSNDGGSDDTPHAGRTGGDR